jgi:hypothetical protein
MAGKRRAERVERSQISILLEDDLIETINQMADAESRSRSRQISVLLREAIDARGSARRPVTRKREAA